METTRLKKFATEARNTLIKGIVSRLKSLGFDENGTVMDGFRPEQIQGGALFLNRTVSEDFYKKWIALEQTIKLHEKGAKAGVRHVAEEAAYTWFNRFVAIRILQMNGLIEPQLAYASDSNIPLIVENARHGRIPAMDLSDRAELDELLDDDSKTLEQFAILIVAYCHMTPILAKCFGHIDDYTELLLPQDILTDGGFVWMLNNTDYITEDDYKQTELIGWLYQFYISEKKDEVFASFKNKKKAEADDIPAATQIFTPNWIVKYMVQNTLGRIYLDNNPNSKLSADWKYLIDERRQPCKASDATNKVGHGRAERLGQERSDCPKTKDEGSIYKFTELEQLKVADFACGSGHILNEFFDMLYAFYIDEDYSKSEAIENIFKKNLLGIDLDTRAKQLSMFSLLLKACQKDRKFIDAKILPRVISCQDAAESVSSLSLPKGTESPRVKQELTEAFDLVKQAANLGSCIKFNISPETREFLQTLCHPKRTLEPKAIGEVEGSRAAIDFILALTDKYSAVVMNPPYMGNGNMNAELSDYVKNNYPNGKTDLATVFIEVQQARTDKNGLFAYIIPPSWMFLGTFEDLRKDIISRNSIQSLLHLSRGVFGADFGASSAVIKNAKIEGSTGTYFRLVERTFQEFEQSHLRMLFEQTLESHDFKYKFKDYSKDVSELPYSEDGNRIYYPNVFQSNFEKIPGYNLGYWISEETVSLFTHKIGDFATAKNGITTADNDKFLRFWYEIDDNKSSTKVGISQQPKWIAYNKGGAKRRWYGNLEYVIEWENNGYRIKNFVDGKGKKLASIRNESFYFKECLSWSDMSSSGTSFRFYPAGMIFDASANAAFVENNLKLKVLALFNTKLGDFFAKILNPGWHFKIGNFESLPYKNVPQLNEDSIRQNISISKADWDAHETSWDFQKNELLAMSLEDEDANVQYDIDEAAKQGIGMDVTREAPEPGKLSWRMSVYQGKWERLFKQLHANEEELNRQFIDIYGLQDEITPNVPLDEVTILQQGEISVDSSTTPNGSAQDDRIEWHEDVVIKQFISYAIGCMMGRYRLDKPGLAIAHSNATDEEIAPYAVDSIASSRLQNDNSESQIWKIDDDGIIPLMTKECAFTDNAVNRFTDFLRVVFGADSLTDNLNFVEKCLDKTVEEYLYKDFWHDHKKMYQNRPIYWLFASKKGAFKVIAYMHRMNRYTLERIRSHYLLPHIDYLKNRVESLRQNVADLSAADRKTLKRLETNLAECLEYHDILHEYADKQIEFDLDDGVVNNLKLFGKVVVSPK